MKIKLCVTITPVMMQQANDAIIALCFKRNESAASELYILYLIRIDVRGGQTLK